MKQTIKLNETELKRMIAESVKRVLNEDDNFEGAEGIVQVLEKNGLSHTAARATEGAITYVAGIRNFDLLTRMAQYIQKAVDDEHEWIMRDRTISECLRRLNEGGHLYHKDEDGNVWTNSKETYRGVPGSTYIWHGEWSDPEILWKGVSLNATDVEDSLWYEYKDECEENGEQPTENGFDVWAQNADIASILDELVWGANGNP